MATVKESLIAARALIDTPEKFVTCGRSKSAALCAVTKTWEEYSAADQALAKHQMRGTSHTDVMKQFDRAIAAQDVTP